MATKLRSAGVIFAAFLTIAATVSGYATAQNRGIESISLNQSFSMQMPPNFGSIQVVRGDWFYGEIYGPLAGERDSNRQALLVLAFEDDEETTTDRFVEWFIDNNFQNYCTFDLSTPDFFRDMPRSDGAYFVGWCDNRVPNATPLAHHDARHEVVAIRSVRDARAHYVVMYVWGVDGETAATMMQDPLFKDNIEPALLSAEVVQ